MPIRKRSGLLTLQQIKDIIVQEAFEQYRPPENASQRTDNGGPHEGTTRWKAREEGKEKKEVVLEEEEVEEEEVEEEEEKEEEQREAKLRQESEGGSSSHATTENSPQELSGMDIDPTETIRAPAGKDITYMTSSPVESISTTARTRSVGSVAEIE